MRKFRVLLLTFVVAVTMMAGSLSVFAAGETPTETEPTVTKTVNVADGITIADDVVLTVHQVSNADNVVAPMTVDDYTVTISKADLNGTDHQKAGVSLGLEAKTTAVGEYTFMVTETSPTAKAADAAYGWTVDTSVYYVHVYVDKDKNHQYLLTKTDNAVETIGEGDAATSQLKNKTDKFEFVNTFTKGADLTIEKTVSNPTYVDADTYYEFTITFTGNDTVTVPSEGFEFTGTKASLNKTDAASTGSLKSGDKFYLQDGGSIKFEGIPAGVKYTVTETAATNVASTTVTVDGEGITDGATQTLDENNDVVSYTNTYKDVTITGVIMNVLPFVMMIAIAGAAAAMYVASRRRKAARY